MRDKQYGFTVPCYALSGKQTEIASYVYISQPITRR